MMNYNQLSTYQEVMETLKDHPTTRGHLKSPRNKPQKQATAKAVYATLSTNTCLNCWLMYTAIV